MPAVWTADGSKAGPTNNPFLEWIGYAGAGNMALGAHEKINLISTIDDGSSPMSGTYAYRHEIAWSGKPDGLTSAFGDRLELLNGKPAGEGSVPSGMPLKVRQCKEGDELWVATAFYFPTLPKPEIHWSEDGTGALPVLQFHGANSETDFSPGAMGGLKIHYTQEINEFDGSPYNPQIYITSEANEFNTPLKAKTWYRVIFRIVFKASGGTMNSWLAEGKSAPFNKVLTSTAKTTIGTAFVFPCQGGPRNEETEPHVTTHDDHLLRPNTELVFYDKMVFLEAAGSEAATLAEAEEVLKPASPEMRIAYSGSNEKAFGAVTSLSIPKPATVKVGDTMLIAMFLGDTGKAITSSGWTEVRKVEEAGAPFTFIVLRKTYEGEAGPYVVEWGGTSLNATGVIDSYVSVNPTAPVEGSVGAVSAGSSATLPAVSLTTGKPNAMLVYCSTNTLGNKLKQPLGMAKRIDQPGTAICDVLQTSAGASGNKEAILPEGAARSAVIMLALAPLILPPAPPSPRNAQALALFRGAAR